MLNRVLLLFFALLSRPCNNVVGIFTIALKSISCITVVTPI